MVLDIVTQPTKIKLPSQTKIECLIDVGPNIECLIYPFCVFFDLFIDSNRFMLRPT